MLSLIQKDYLNVINFCNLSLEIDPTFDKPLVNRAEAYYELKKFEESLVGRILTYLDLKKIAKEHPHFANPAREQQCQKEVDKDIEKKKDQVLGQLKNLGNSILGRFGMSLDQFNMQKNEQGGYSVNFNNK